MANKPLTLHWAKGEAVAPGEHFYSRAHFTFLFTDGSKLFCNAEGPLGAVEAVDLTNEAPRDSIEVLGASGTECRNYLEKVGSLHIYAGELPSRFNVQKKAIKLQSANALYLEVVLGEGGPEPLTCRWSLTKLKSQSKDEDSVHFSKRKPMPAASQNSLCPSVAFVTVTLDDLFREPREELLW